jgi:hypothetical protein
VLLAGAPSAESLAQLPQRLPVLVVQGTRDGVVRFSEFAVSRHRALAAGLSHARFVTVPGASHHSFTSAPKLSPLASEVCVQLVVCPPRPLTQPNNPSSLNAPPCSVEVDLTSSLGQDLTHGNISAIVEDWVRALPTVHGGALETGEVLLPGASSPVC